MKTIFLLPCALFIGSSVLAQSDSLSLPMIKLSEVVFSANKTEENKSDIPYSIQVMDSKTIALENPQTAADMIANTGMVMVQKSQAGGGSPIIRGFEANRVLIVIDGVRMNNAIYRGGHLQDVITVDNSIIDRTEIVFGPSSVMYGSDAIGGVMHFYTKKPRFSRGDSSVINVSSYLRYASANQEKTGHVDVNWGFKKVASFTSISYSEFDDVRTGRVHTSHPDFGKNYYYAERNLAGTADSMIKNPNPNIQKKTGYTQVDLMEKLLFNVNDFVELGANFQFSTSSNINRFDRLSQYNGNTLKYAEWYYGPQDRFLAAINSNIQSGGLFFDKLAMVASFQNLKQSRMSRKFNNDNLRSQNEEVKVLSLNADFSKKLNDKQLVRYGLSVSHNGVSSTASTKNIVTNEKVSPTDTRYPNGGSETMSAAAYLTHKWNISEKVILSEGLRFTTYSLTAKFDTSAAVSTFQFPFTSITQRNTALNGNLGLVLKPIRYLRFSLLGSTGFRAPNVDDVSKVFESQGNLLVVPNANLKPENAYNGEASMDVYLWDEKISLQGGYYYTLLDNAIVLQDAQYEGKDSLLFNGTMTKVVSSKNADHATVQGAWATLRAELTDALTLKSSINFTRGKYYDSKQDTLLPMDHIAPTFGQTSLMLHYKKMDAEAYVRYSAPKLRKDYALGKEDNEKMSADPIYGYMPAWHTLNVKMVWHVNRNFYVNMGIENILDRHYRVFASGVSASGRNVMLGLRIKF